ncbi:MAG TPA: hypothetical protein VJ346_04270 [Bacteroidales bacterium]|nr:hypothetical protein [Bacteroidales bacterium]
MKIEKKILTTVLFCLIILAGCKKDKDEDSSDNYIKYDGKMYPVDKGVLENFGDNDDGVYNLDLSLISDGITLIESQGELTGATGTGNIIYFEMYTNSSTQLDNGNYEYNYLAEEPGTFDEGWIGINYDFDDEEGDIELEIEDGTITVTKNGYVYEITISCTDDAAKSVTGYYKGTLKYYDYGEKKSTITDKRRF